MLTKQLVRNSIKSKVPIWKLLPMEGTNFLALEHRDEVKREVTFSLYDFIDQRYVWQYVGINERWWITLDGTSGEKLILRKYENTENPDKTTRCALSLKTGKLVELDLDKEMEMNTIQVTHPFLYVEGEPEFETVKKFINQSLKMKTVLGAEYVEHNDLIFVSFYAGPPADYKNHLAAFERHGSCIINEEIGSNLKGIGTNTFFIFSNHIFFVKNRTELVTFRIV